MTVSLQSTELDKLFSSYSISKWGYTESIVPSSLEHFEKWRTAGKAGPLNYLTDHRGDIRSSLSNFYSEYQSALVFLFDYSESRRELEKIFKSNDSNGARISAYTLGFEGEDYHLYLGKTLAEIAQKLEAQWGVDGKLTLDVHPVLELSLIHI